MPRLRIADGSLEIHYRESGSEPVPLVLIHGFPFSSEMWRPQIDRLADAYRVIAPDLRGFGASRPSPQPYSLARLADDVVELLDALDLDRAAIGALSLGDYVALELFRRHRARVAALVLADTRPQPDTAEARANRARLAELARREGSAAVTDELLPKLLAPTTRTARPELESELRDMSESAAPDAFNRLLLEFLDAAATPEGRGESP